MPGILARQGDPPRGDFMPYRSDWNHPSAFWIMNGWNDFQYNMAAGVTACGSCYWLLPGANGGPSMFETWDGYASQQLDVQETSSFRMDNTGRSGLTPLTELCWEQLRCRPALVHQHRRYLRLRRVQRRPRE